ncbi:hypothetical protein B0T21DRAFT_428970 [Apiosordaria backusii]|uniref:Uncharacterized protein n=1 Tax=Apiosordaria backusii TaxID=314023 RepID=A0AA40ES14_9PEZI|nr:hypothetical protein B0T21DRAFT_428970 [Apiosordaria backusii]
MVDARNYLEVRSFLSSGSTNVEESERGWTPLSHRASRIVNHPSITPSSRLSTITDGSSCGSPFEAVGEFPQLPSSPLDKRLIIQATSCSFIARSLAEGKEDKRVRKGRSSLPALSDGPAVYEVRFLDAARLLLRYSMIEARESVQGSGSGSSYSSIYPVVHRWTSHIQDDKGKRWFLRLALMVVGFSVPNSTAKDYWVLQRRLLPHAERCSWWALNHRILVHLQRRNYHPKLPEILEEAFQKPSRPYGIIDLPDGHGSQQLTMHQDSNAEFSSALSIPPCERIRTVNLVNISLKYSIYNFKEGTNAYLSIEQLLQLNIAKKSN